MSVPHYYATVAVNFCDNLLCHPVLPLHLFKTEFIITSERADVRQQAVRIMNTLFPDCTTEIRLSGQTPVEFSSGVDLVINVSGGYVKEFLRERGLL